MLRCKSHPISKVKDNNPFVSSAKGVAKHLRIAITTKLNKASASHEDNEEMGEKIRKMESAIQNR